MFRMGINVLKPLKSSNPKVIDYANSDMRNEFMDIYLSAMCNFFMSMGSGIDGVPIIFRRPIAYIGHLPFGNFARKNNNLSLIHI